MFAEKLRKVQTAFCDKVAKKVGNSQQYITFCVAKSFEQADIGFYSERRFSSVNRRTRHPVRNFSL